jgi:hypothetical protein
MLALTLRIFIAVDRMELDLRQWWQRRGCTGQPALAVRQALISEQLYQFVLVRAKLSRVSSR